MGCWFFGCCVCELFLRWVIFSRGGMGLRSYTVNLRPTSPCLVPHPPPLTSSNERASGLFGCNALVPSRAEPLLPLGTCFCPISASVCSRLAVVFRQRGTHPLYCLLPWGCRWRQLRLCVVKLALPSGFDGVPGRPEIFRSGAFCSTTNTDAHCCRLPDTAAHSSSHRRSLARLGHRRLLASCSFGRPLLSVVRLAACLCSPPPQGHLQRCRKIITHCPKSLRARHTQRLCTEFIKIVPRGTGTALGEGTENESRPPRRVVPGR